MNQNQSQIRFRVRVRFRSESVSDQSQVFCCNMAFRPGQASVGVVFCYILPDSMFWSTVMTMATSAATFLHVCRALPPNRACMPLNGCVLQCSDPMLRSALQLSSPVKSGRVSNFDRFELLLRQGTPPCERMRVLMCVSGSDRVKVNTNV